MSQTMRCPAPNRLCYAESVPGVHAGVRLVAAADRQGIVALHNDEPLSLQVARVAPLTVSIDLTMFFRDRSSWLALPDLRLCT